VVASRISGRSKQLPKMSLCRVRLRRVGYVPPFTSSGTAGVLDMTGCVEVSKGWNEPADRTARHGRSPSVGVSAVPNPVLLVSQHDAARLLGVERTTIWRMCGRGDLARVRIGRRSLITMESINAFIRSQVESVRDD
jgi:excisionase family DNA binding protein